jgi:hypothetical protein
MSNPPQLDSDPLDDPEFLRFIGSDGFPGSFAVPEGHEGPYLPSPEQFAQGVRAALEAAMRTVRARAKAVDEQLPLLFAPETKP